MYLINLPKKKTIPKLFPGFYWATTKRNQDEITDNVKTRLMIVRISGKEPFLTWETWHISGQSPKHYKAMENCPNFVLGSKIQHYGALNTNIIDMEDIVSGFYWGKLISSPRNGIVRNDVIIYVFGEKPFLKLLALDTDNGNVYTINNIDSIKVVSRIQQPCVNCTTIKPVVKKGFTVLRGM